MARILIALLFMFAACAAQAADLVWLNDLAQAQTQAHQEMKLTLLFFHGSDWCRPCAEMQKQVFDSPQFIAFAQKSLVLVDVDFPESAPQSPELKRANAALKAKFNIGDNFPTVVLLNASGETVFQEMGYDGAGPDEFLKILARHALDAKAPEGTAKYQNLEVEEFAKLAADRKNIVLDVRTRKEFQAGHLPVR